MNPPIDRTTALRMMERMLLIRRFEEKLVDLAAKKLVGGIYHLYIGQEAAATGVLEGLKPEDRVLSNHRNHGHVLGRGADPGRAMAEILGREAGLLGGRSGSFHLSDPATGTLPTLAILGGNVSLALGAAYSFQRTGQKRIVTVFFGDASVEEGVTYEVLNMAALRRLPILFVLENNNSETLSLDAGAAANTTLKDFTRIPALYGIASVKFEDGNDASAILTATRVARERALKGEGPTFFEIRSERWPGGNSHLSPELVTGRTDLRAGWGDTPIEGEHADWTRNFDPVLRLARDVVLWGLADKRELLDCDRAVSQKIDEAADFAVSSPFPAPEAAFAHVFA